MSAWRFAAASLAAGLLFACSTAPVAPRPERSSLERFVLDGRLAISQPSGANTVRINWDHGARQDRIGFYSPLGSQLALLSRDDAGARWEAADGEVTEAASIDDLVVYLTEFFVPVDALSRWVRGRVSDHARAIGLDAQGRLLQAEDAGWQVRILAYENETPNALPRTLEVRRDGMRVRLVIEEWHL
ncbi:MAG: outer membrane lipoprotein LolB [Candidatus Dactylopiibacterium carminicum]|nr:MAG: outer membrane lipoprotein LolB [Candidatus Dactylopiibacterium carminicum]